MRPNPGPGPRSQRGTPHEAENGPRKAGFFRRLYITLRTEHTTPAKVAAAVGVGIFVGCSPFWGFHLALSVIFATIFRLNRVLVYAVANFANPVTAPLLVFGQVQIGHRIVDGAWLPVALEQFRQVGLPGLFIDFFVGSLVVGSGLGAGIAMLVYLAARGGERPGTYTPLVDTVVLRYLDASIRDAEGARNALLGDPIYPALLEDPLFLSDTRILDLGCGRGVAAVLGLACGGDDVRGRTYLGVDHAYRYVRVAREVIGSAEGHRIVQEDLRDFDPPAADLVLLVNVLRFLPPGAQDALLRRLGRALPPGARVLVRDVDVGAGWRFRAAAAADVLGLFLPGRTRYGFHYRRASDVRNALAAAGFDVRERIPARGASEARFLLEAVRKPVTARRPD